MSVERVATDPPKPRGEDQGSQRPSASSTHSHSLTPEKEEENPSPQTPDMQFSKINTRSDSDVKIDIEHSPSSHSSRSSHSGDSAQSSSLGAIQPPIDISPTNEQLENSVQFRLPSHTVPFTKQASESPFETFMEQLMSMGYPYQQCERALAYCNCRSIEEAIDFLTLSPADLRHPFTPMNLLVTRPSVSNNASPQTRGHRSDSTRSQTSPRDEEGQETGDGDRHSAISPDSPVVEDSGRKPSDLAEHYIVCALCGYEEPYHIKEEEHSKSFSLDKMEISDDPIVAQRQRRIQFEARMLKQRELRAKSEEKEEKMDGDEGPTKFCEICLEDKPERGFFSGKCGHGFCLLCSKEHYRVKICDANVLDLRCMHFGCDRKIKEEEILKHFQSDAGMMEKYKKFKRNALLARNKNCRWCPKPGCETPMIGSPRKPRLQCPECKTVICFNCNQDWHPNKKCDDLIDEKYSKWAKGKDIQLCPKCKARVWKNMGCNHMTCPSCHHQFCWLCRGTYRSESHFAPWNFLGCPGRQFAYESGVRPNILMRALWRLGIFLLVIILGALAIGLGAAALGVIIVVGVVCCPCIVIYQGKKIRDQRRRDSMHNHRVPHVERRSSSSLVVPRFERREFEAYLPDRQQPNVQDIDGILHVMNEEGNLVDINSFERSQFLSEVTSMGFEREHVLQAVQQYGYNLSQVVDWLIENPYLGPGFNDANEIEFRESELDDHVQGDANVVNSTEEDAEEITNL